MRQGLGMRALGVLVGLSGAVLLAGVAEAGTLTRTSSFTYDATSGLLTQQVIEPSNTTYRVQTDFTLDAFGNQTAKTVSGGNITSRTTGAGFDSQGRFPTSLTNAKSQVTTESFNSAFGGDPTSITDPNTVTSTTSYDSWGRKTLVVAGDGTRISYQYQYCSGVNGGTAACPTYGAYRVIATPLAADGTSQIGQIVTTYYDSLEREIAKDNQGMDGSQIRAATQYDAKGRVQQTSRPYFVATGSAHWTVFTYDDLARVTLETRPDGSTIQHAYHGISVIDTNQLSQTQTTVKNSQGEVVSVKDNLNNTTTFAYDPFGNLTTTTDSQNHVIGNSYDLYGRKIAMSDPDMGNWSYGYDVLGELTSQTNARSQTASLAYDVLGRVTNRSEPDLTSSWTYDTQAHGIGKLAGASTDGGVSRSFTYDSYGRPTQTAVTVDGSTYTTTSNYNTLGKVGSVSYASGFQIAYSYNTIGYLTQISDVTSGSAYWTANAYDAEGHRTQETAGNGVVTTSAYNLDTGRIATIQAGANNGVQNQSFTFNALGNLTNRTDNVTQESDDLTYDGLNRLTQSVSNNPSLTFSATKTVAYDAIGNITSKTDVGVYNYDQVHVHAISAITPGSVGTVNASYVYDADGNLLTGNNRTVSWTSFDMVNQVTQGTNALTFSYDSNHARIKEVSSDGSTKYYLNDPTSGVLEEKVIGAGAAISWNDYILVGAEMVALHVSGNTPATRYFHKDHLGSIAVITDATGAVVERDSYDAWGERRNPQGPNDPLYPALSITSQVSRGFTGHEQLDGVGLIHMNGRIYDAVIGKMLSADPNVTDPTNGQNYNRYAYVLNNPLSLTDPTGFKPDPGDGSSDNHGHGTGGGSGDNGSGGDSPGGGNTPGNGGDGSDSDKGAAAGDVGDGSTNSSSSLNDGPRFPGIDSKRLERGAAPATGSPGYSGGTENSNPSNNSTAGVGGDDASRSINKDGEQVAQGVEIAPPRPVVDFSPTNTQQSVKAAADALNQMTPKPEGVDLFGSNPVVSADQQIQQRDAAIAQSKFDARNPSVPDGQCRPDPLNSNNQVVGPTRPNPEEASQGKILN